jgi:hypothetical protein
MMSPLCVTSDKKMCTYCMYSITSDKKCTYCMTSLLMPVGGGYLLPGDVQNDVCGEGRCKNSPGEVQNEVKGGAKRSEGRCKTM